MRSVPCCVLTFLALVLSSGGGLRGQEYKPPPANLPSDEEVKQILEKGNRLAQTLALLRKQTVPENLLVDADVYLQAVQAIMQHKEFYQKDSAAWTLAALERGLLRTRFLGQGDAPWVVAPGQDVARGYRSRVDGSIQPFAVSFPADFGKDPKKRWRVDVELHGRDTSLTEVKFLHAHNGEKAVPKDQDFVKLSIYGRGNNAYRWAGETDVLDVIAWFFTTEKAAGRGHLLDPARIVLRGFSMGGAGTWHLGLHWPDRWCAIGPGAGFTATHGYVPNLPETLPPYQEACLRIYDALDYAPNAADVPVVAYSGALDPQKQAADNIEAALKKLGIPITHLVAPDLKHQFPAEWFRKANELYSKYAAKGRPEYPESINFTTYTMKYPGCYWLVILGLDRQYERAAVKAEHVENGFHLKTQNVRALKLNLPDATGQAQEIDIDSQKLVARPTPGPSGSDSIYLQRRAGKWVPVLPQRLLVQQGQKPRKVHNLQGPIDEAFCDSFLCVRGTGKPWHEATQKHVDARLQRFAFEWSKYWRGQLPVKDDADVTNEDIAGRNLILFGDPSSNSLIAQVLDGLPLEWTADEIRLAGQKVAADKHLPVLIYPNPLNPQRYVVLNSGHTFPTADYEKTNALLFPRLGDFALLRLAATAEDPSASEVITAGLFDDFWSVGKN
jgi:predicted esterase